MTVKKPHHRATVKQMDFFLYQRSVFAFLLFFALALWGFWTSYYGKLLAEYPPQVRLHGIAMTLWCLLLILQSGLIRTRHLSVHRWTGRLSYVLVPFILLSGFHIAHITVSEMQAGTGPYYYFIALMFNSLVLFAVLYGLAIYHRKHPLIHARFMVCTVLPLITPISDRIIYKYVDGLVRFVPVLEGMPMVQVLGFAVGDIILLGLLIWDWMAHRQWKVFTLALALVMLYHLSVYSFHQFSWWRQTGDWIMASSFF